jgi:hypothetical protein
MPANRVTVTTQAEFQQALNDAASLPISCIDIANDTIVLTSPLILPRTLNAASKRLIINGNGATIKPHTTLTTPIPALIMRQATSQTEALNIMQSHSFHFNDIMFDGRGVAVSGIDLAATYGSSVVNCSFRSSQYGLYLRFGLMARVINCLSNAITNTPFVADMGNWTDANNVNSQSNHTRFEQCRVFNAQGAFAGFAIYAASGVVLDQCISEGAQPNYHVFFESRGSTVVKDFTMRNTHLESVATVAGIRLRLAGGYATISDVYSQFDMVLIDAEAATGYPHLYVKNVPWLTGGTQFKTTGTAVIWSFEEIYQPTQIFNTTRWVGGVIPFYRYAEFFNQSKQILTNSMRVNNKLIS